LFGRRSLLKLGLGALGVGLAAPRLAFAEQAAGADMRSVAMDNLHTGEQLQAVYWEQGQYIPDVLDAVNEHLRDFRTGDVHPIDPAVLDILADLRARADREDAYEVISGYRSPKTNAELHEHSSGVAEHSLHMEGRAIDVRLPGFATARLHQLALDMGRGGVGFYASSDFVHLDNGRVRHW
jgi:uncharacterized protein YcbK (DUF882 family)